jgi:hypothetical protein
VRCNNFQPQPWNSGRAPGVLGTVWGEELDRDMLSAAGFTHIEVNQPALARDRAQKRRVHFTCRLPPFILHGLLKQQHDGLD